MAKDTHDITQLVAQEWGALAAPITDISASLVPYLTDPQDAQLRHEMYRALFAGVSLGYLGLLNGDGRHPDFFPYTTQAYNAFANNPDDDYYVTPVDDDGVYRITGFRGTVKTIDFQVGSGSFVPRGVVDDQYLGRSLGNFDLDHDVKLDADGGFEVILSPTRPAGHEGDWWQLKPGASYIMVRQISYDWLREVDGRLAIERLDTPAVKPRPSAETLAANLRQIAVWAESTVRTSADLVTGIRRDQGINKINYKDLSQYAGHLTQRYAYGGFDLAPDEALIIEAKVPAQCHYWSIHLIDDLSFIVDWMHRQTSINGFTARIDKDGYFRVVVSARDPGVANWLDTANYKTGGIQIRWEKCDTWPEHKAQLVKVAQVREYLPADTALVTPEERDAAIRLRRRGAQMRKRW